MNFGDESRLNSLSSNWSASDGDGKFRDCIEEHRSVRRNRGNPRIRPTSGSRITQIYSSRMNSVNALHYSGDKGATAMYVTFRYNVRHKSAIAVTFISTCSDIVCRAGLRVFPNAKLPCQTIGNLIIIGGISNFITIIRISMI